MKPPIKQFLLDKLQPQEELRTRNNVNSDKEILPNYKKWIYYPTEEGYIQSTNSCSVLLITLKRLRKALDMQQ